MRKNHSEEWKYLHNRSLMDKIGLKATFVVRYAIAAAVVWYVINFLSPLPSPWRHPVHIVAALIVVGLMIASRRIKKTSISLERTFVQNLRSREVKQQNEAPGRPSYAGRLLSHNMHFAQIQLPDNTRWGGMTLRELDLGRKDGVLITAVIRNKYRINIPDGQTQLFPSDKIEALGDDESIESLVKRINAEIISLSPNDSQHHLVLKRFVVSKESMLCDIALKSSRLRDDFHCMAVGFETEEGTIDTAESARIIHSGDVLWVVGEDKAVKQLVAENASMPQK